MTDEERLAELLRRAVPPVRFHALDEARPSHDLWPRVVHRIEAPPRWSPFDLALAAAVAIALILFPQALWLIAYHL